MGNLLVPAENGQQSHSEVALKDSGEGKSASNTPDDLLRVEEQMTLGETIPGQWPMAWPPD